MTNRTLKIQRTAATLATALFACLAQSAPVTTFGDIDCGEWLSRPRPEHRVWLAGYMSGLSGMYLVVQQKDTLKSVASIDQLVVWMNNYCQKNPLTNVSQGGLDLFVELSQKTLKK